jgi:hypothetical protein
VIVDDEIHRLAQYKLWSLSWVIICSNMVLNLYTHVYTDFDFVDEVFQYWPRWR